MSRETSAGTGKLYGLERVCRVLESPRSTIYAQQARDSATVVPLRPQRRGPKPKMPDPELLWPSAPIWKPRSSPARGTEKSGRGCASCGAFASPATNFTASARNSAVYRRFAIRRLAPPFAIAKNPKC
jgi:hypothetical protein